MWIIFCWSPIHNRRLNQQTKQDNPWTVLHTFNWQFALYIVFSFFKHIILTMFWEGFFPPLLMLCIVTVVFVDGFFYCGAVIPFIRFCGLFIQYLFLFMFLCYTDQTGNYFTYNNDFCVVFGEKKILSQINVPIHKHIYIHTQTLINKYMKIP